MNDLIWWVGAVHMAVYSAVGTAAVLWFTIEQTLKRLKLTKTVIEWLWDRARKRAAAKKAEDGA